MDNYKKTLLPSGVTVCSEFMPSAFSAVIGIYVTVGSRDEDEGNAGISHFIEHSVFKGTKNRTEREISRVIESRGGVLNASTSREWTSFYVHVLPEEIELGIDVLTDLIENPRFSEEALKAERNVILQEIKMFKDSPESLLFNYAFKSTFGKHHPLSKLILGSSESVKNIKRQDILDFRNKSWSSDRIFVSAVGKVNHENICDLIDNKIDKKNGSSSKRASISIKNKKINKFNKAELNHQYITLSFPTFPYDNELRFPLLISGTILGSGMSSLLFQKLRQELSYVYEVSAFTEFFSDTGIFGIYFSTGKNKLQDSLNATKDLLDTLDFSEEQVETAKERLRGNIVILLEGISNRMERNVKEEIYRGERSSISDLLDKIDSVSLKKVRATAEKYLRPENFILTVLGDGNNVFW